MVRVLQQDEGLAHRAARDSAVLGCPQQLKVAGQWPRRRSSLAFTFIHTRIDKILDHL